MARLGWVDATRKISEKIENLFFFFKVTSVKAWNDYFIDQQLKSAFRISLAGTSDPYAISAWLRRGEILAAEMETKQPYSEATLKEKIPLMLALVEEQPEDFAAKLRDLCSEAGVKIIYMHHIPHAPVNGCIRWIDDVPCVQLTDKQKRNDVFWFSFFHELGHILLHGKKDVFLEDTRYSSMMQEKEYEADCFASEKLLSSKLEEALIRELSTHKPTVAYLEAKAREYRTHPAILVGRLQHKGLLRQDSSLNGLKVTISVDGSDITTPVYDRK